MHATISLRRQFDNYEAGDEAKGELGLGATLWTRASTSSETAGAENDLLHQSEQ